MKKLLAIAFILLHAVSAYATDYYVDNDYLGTPRNGTASNPWRSLSDTVTNNPWNTINTALAAADVNVYFSAREAATDTSDTCCEITVSRTDGSTHRLTLDGMTKWNTNDTTPSWMDYGGSPTRDTPKGLVYNAAGNGWAIGWGVSGIIPAMDYVTIRGFEATGSRARFRLEGGGSHFIVEYNYVHDVTVGGPGMQFNAGAYAYSSGPTSVNPAGICTLRVSHLSDDVIFRYNHINNTADENLYFGGNGEDGSGHGFDCPGHTNIQFIGNTLSNAGIGVGEGDCFDLKNGVRSITYSGNIVGPCKRNGIPLQGAAVSYQPQTVLVEGNIVHDTNTSGGTGAITLINTWTTVPSGVTVQNNIIYNGWLTGNDGNSNTNGDGAKYNINFINNTIDSGNVAMKYINTGSLKNNIILGGIIYSQTSSFTDDYNAVTAGGGGSGTHSIALSAGQISALFVDRTAHNYQLASTSSAAYNTGTNTGCPATDYYGVSRPQAVICDIGAAEFDAGGSPTPPTPGNSGTMSTAAVTSTTLTVNWTKATDTTTPQNQLQYKVATASSNTISTVAGCEAATVLQAFTPDIATFNVTGRTPLSTNWFCVVVMNNDGLKSVYTPTSATMTCGATKIVFTSQPSNALLGASLGTVVVKVENSSDTVCSDDSSTQVTLSKNISATWGTLVTTSSLTRTVTAGVATWAGDLSVITTTGAGSIDAGATGGLTGATSNSITISTSDTPPVPGGGGVIAITSVSSSRLTLSWTLATDDNTGLTYEVRQANQPMNSIAEAEANGKVIKAYTADLAMLTVSNLKISQTPCFAVIVKDTSGQKAFYPSANAKYGWHGTN